jgi:hypothetical protein
MQVFEIPLEILDLQDNGFHPLVKVVVLGKTFEVVLDTGASRTAFDKELLEEIEGIAAMEETNCLSTGLGTTSMPSYTLTLPEFSIGDLDISNFQVAVLDLSMINHAYSQLERNPVLGVLGGDILMKYRAVIDYGEQRLSLYQ